MFDFRMPSRSQMRDLALLHSLGVAITFATLIFDMMVPLGVAAAVPYALLVLLSLRSPGRALTWFAIVSTTFLTVLGYYLSPPGGEPWIVLTNRLLSLLVIWVTGYLVFEQKRKASQIERERMGRVQAEKLASLGEMAAGVAHELGNPLAAMQGRVELLEIKLTKPGLDREEVKKFSSIMLHLTERMARIIRGMQALARDSSADPFEPASVARIVREAVDLSAEKIQKWDIDLRLGFLDEDLILSCREAQINQILVNLINNAVDAIRELPERFIQIDVSEKRAEIEISVVDSGKGIAREVARKMMEPFFTTKEIGKGTGLGLSISKSIVEAHAGSIEVDLTFPHTRFVVRLPKHRGRFA